MNSEIYAELNCRYIGQVLAGLGKYQAEGVFEITQSRTASVPKVSSFVKTYVLALAGSPDRGLVTD